MPNFFRTPLPFQYIHNSDKGVRTEPSFAKDQELSGVKVMFWVVLASVLIRLFYLGFACLLPVEAYYWQYANHLDLAYLDHPPMVALTIFLGTKIFGVNEFAVRIGALVWWSVAAVFVYLLAREIFGKKTAHASILLFSVLPYFFFIGFLETPDSPLTAFWAGALYFLYRALVGQHGRSWWGVGFCLGLGMLSKYSIALLLPATIGYMILDAKSRSYFLKFRPYLAAVVAILFFSPVLIWNYNHHWVSFAFQSAHRLTEPKEFSLHLLLLHIIAVLSPVGVYVFAKSIEGLRRKEAQLFYAAQRETNLFVWVFTFVPLLVFVFFSFTHEVKVNWTGPVFLAFLPFLGRSLVIGISGGHRVIAAGWKWTVVLLLLGFALSFQYVSFGLPGVPYPANMHKFLTGSKIASQILQLERQVERTEGQRPVVVGMDKNYLSSQFGFYREKAKEANEMLEHTAGSNLLGRESLMYRFWTNPKDYEGRNMILITRDKDDLHPALLSPYFRSLGQMQELKNQKDGYVVGRFYYRVAFGYRDPGKGGK